MPDTPSHRITLGATRLDGIDLLRGLAIFFVLMNHINMRLFLAGVPYADGLSHQLKSSLVWSGQYGVQIFFTVSGFLITSTSLERWGSLSGIDVSGFYALRAARIAPLLLLLLTALAALHLAGLPDFVVPAETGGLGRAVLAALTFHVNVLEAQRGYLPANWDILWSLSVEEAFYLAFPLLCALLRPAKLLAAFLVVMVILGPFGRTLFTHGNDIWQEYSYLGGMDAIALGCLTAMMLPLLRKRRLPLRAVGATGMTALALVIGASDQIKAWGVDQAGLDMTLLALGTCLVIVAAARSRWHSPSVLRPLLKLGQRSYEIYLTHMFVVFALFDAFMAAGKPAPMVPLLFIAVVCLAALFGSAVARVFSEPMNKRLREF